MDVDDAPPAAVAAEDDDTRQQQQQQPPSLFIHTSSETFLIYPQALMPPADGDKENVRVQPASVWRYTVAVMTRVSAADARQKDDDPPAVAVASEASEAVPELLAPPEPVKEITADDGEDMSISPSESSKPSVNGDVDPPADGAPRPEEKAAEATKETSADKHETGTDGKAAPDDPAHDTKVAEDDASSKAEPQGVNANTEEAKQTPAAASTTTEESNSAAAASDAQARGSSPSGQAKVLPTPPKEPAPKKKALSTLLQVLQRDLTEDEFVFDTDGVGVVGRVIENGTRKGWKIEAKSWRLAGADALPLIETAIVV